jgi:hypothetical protein
MLIVKLNYDKDNTELRTAPDPQSSHQINEQQEANAGLGIEIEPK